MSPKVIEEAAAASAASVDKGTPTNGPMLASVQLGQTKVKAMMMEVKEVVVKVMETQLSIIVGVATISAISESESNSIS